MKLWEDECAGGTAKLREELGGVGEDTISRSSSGSHIGGGEGESTRT